MLFGVPAERLLQLVLAHLRQDDILHDHEWPLTPAATREVLIWCSLKMLVITLETLLSSMIWPSTIVSG